METTSSNRESVGSSGEQHSPGYEGLKLNLNPAANFDQFLLGEGEIGEEEIADDLELLEYQRSRSTPKIEIQEFEDDGKSAEFRQAQEKHKKEMFTQVTLFILLIIFTQLYDSHLKGKYENPKYYTLEEVAQHNSELDCWTVINGRIYNITPFVKSHPGGKKILKAAGIDGTELFSKFSHFNLLHLFIPYICVNY